MILRMILLFHLLILGLANGGKVEAQTPAQPCKSTVSGTLGGKAEKGKRCGGICGTGVFAGRTE
jgi:hypothetical protein